MKKGLIATISLLALAAGIIIPLNIIDSSEKVSTCQVSIGDVVSKVTVNAEAYPTETYTAYGRTEGFVKEMSAAIGENVSAGQSLCTMDTAALEKELASLETQATFAAGNSMEQAAKDQAEQSLSIAQSTSMDIAVFNEILAAEKKEEATEKQTENPEQEQAAAASAQAAQTLRDKINSAYVEAPGRGTVLSMEVGPGSAIGPGVPVATIGNLDTMAVIAYVNEADGEQVAVGQRCTFTLEGSGQERTGTVSEVAGRTELIGGTKKCKVIIQPDELLKCRVGATVYAAIELARTENVLRVPIEAMADAENVFVLKNGVVEKREIETGINDGEYVEITYGLQMGEKLILNPDSNWNGGERVTEDDD